MTTRYGISFQECEDIPADMCIEFMSRMQLIAQAETAMLKRGYLDYRFLRIDFRDEYVEFMVG